MSQGQSLIDATLSKDIFDRLRKTQKTEARLSSLSAQERRVLDLIAQGRSNRQIAEEIFLAEKTVKNYVSSLLSKLGMQRRTEAGRLRGHPGRAPGRQPQELTPPGELTRSASVRLQSGSNSMPRSRSISSSRRRSDIGLTKRAGIVVDRHGRTQRQQDAVMVEFTCQVLGHDVLLHARRGGEAAGGTAADRRRAPPLTEALRPRPS